ncbi:MAG: bifunctional phosphopantothenoylcysteine decarboxylase/phosphopantothenate--cysteine ligase CoaBC [Hungatella sp.]|nr:bifunctional phosphopantothenoylcysteine decarboxylase/phosphopantothenate--cysteine ligase CoaBC [Hungatella sp.]MTK06569.1 bifunctional phosphopantothenoylcysteine decarboxylase/phosphopantothenate--cysteine ligase CoaBC [Hungatella sp.]
MLRGKNIILGITGSIAAYKSALLTRLLVKEGANVKIVMTPLAKEFITPLTLATLAKNPILVDFFDPTNGNWNSHVNLGLWADAYVIAPATANTLGKMANGIADNLLMTTYFSAKCPVFVAPAMDLDMFQHPATQKNISTLLSYGNHIIDAGTGELASGLEGKGRMAEPEDIVRYLNSYFSETASLTGKKVLITAGPTYEKIDPVRFIGNYSSGKMGFALAQTCAERGAKVTLVSGPVSLTINHPNIERIDVESAKEMYQAASANFADNDIAILCAAVADFTPETRTNQKIKRGKDDLVLNLKPTRDIAASLGAVKRDNQLLIGFALETNDEEENALSKLKRKNFDMIVLNSLRTPQAGFQYNTNQITIIDKNGNKKEYPLKDKKEVANDIVNVIEQKL